MVHAEAIRRGLTEKYLLGELDGDEREAYEAHFFGCEECASDVRAGVRFIEGVRAVREYEPSSDRVAARGRAPWVRWFWPLPIGAAAALSLVLGATLYQAFVVVPHLRHELRAANTLQAVPSFFLSIRRTERDVVTIGPGYRKLALRLSRSSDRVYPYYRCSVRDASESGTLTAVVPGPPPGEELQVVFPASHLPPGAYTVVLDGLNTADGPVAAPAVARYHFTLRHEGK